MRFLITLEQTEEGFAVQAPDLAIATYGVTIDAAKQAARDAIQANLKAYQEAGQEIPRRQPVEVYLEDPDMSDLLFACVEVPPPKECVAA